MSGLRSGIDVTDALRARLEAMRDDESPVSVLRVQIQGEGAIK